MPVKETTKTIYTTDDGQEFTEELDAVLHQAQIDSKDAINAYVEQLPGTDLHQKKTRNMLMKYVQFVAERDYKYPEAANA